MAPILKNYQEFPYELERSEAVYWGKLFESSLPYPKPVKTEIARAMVCAFSGVDILAMNRVIGWGWGETNSDSLSQLISFYQINKCPRFFIQLSPLVPEKESLTQKLQEHGFRLYNSWAKLWRPIVGYNPKVNTFLEIREIGPEDGKVYGQLIVDSFGWEKAQLVPFLAASIGLPGYRHYLVYFEGKAIAAGALHVWGEYASMAFAATLADSRGMGAQSLLIHQRIKDAYAAGARYLVAETATDRPEAPVKSFRNLQKFGFDLIYERENWIYEEGKK